LLVQRVARLRCKPTLYHAFLPLLIQSHQFEQFVKGVQTETAVPHISPDQIREFPVLLPPLDQQIVLSSLIGYWDSAIEKTERLIAAKEHQFQAMIQKLVNEGSRNWDHKKANEIFSEVSSKGHPSAELLSVTQDRGVIPRSMLEGRVMSPGGTLATYKLVHAGDFVISLRSFQGGLEFSAYEGLISPAYTVLRAIVPIDLTFFRFFFKSSIFVQKYLAISVIGIRDGKQISIPDFMLTRLPLPPEDEQRKIATQLEFLQKELTLLTAILEKTREQKQGLMQKLLSGQWRLKTDNQEAPHDPL